MTQLLDILHEVQEGANKHPPLTDYLDAATEFSFDRYWKTIINSQSGADEIYKTALGTVVELIKVMQLASANIEKTAAIEELTHHIGKQPIAMFRIRNRKPVFAYAKRWTRREPQEACRNCPEVDTCEGGVLAKSCTGWV